MKQMIRIAVLCAASAGGLGVAPALAQEEATEEATEDALAEEAAAPQEEPMPATPSAATAIPPAEEDFKWSYWNTRFIDRPRTLPKGMIEAGAYLDFERYTFAGDGGEESSDTITRLYIAGGYGLSKELELRVSYGLTLDEFEGKGPLSVGAGFTLKEGQLALAASGDFVYDLGTEVGEIGLGARARYLVNDDLAVYTARQLQFTVIADGTQPAYLRLPVGVAYQFTDKIYGFAETEIASLNLKDTETVVIFADYVPLTAGGVFALSKKLEVGGLLYTDAKNDPFDSMVIGLFGRAYL